MKNLNRFMAEDKRAVCQGRNRLTRNLGHPRFEDRRRIL